jgi:hypothetical protein
VHVSGEQWLLAWVTGPFILILRLALTLWGSTRFSARAVAS